MAVHLNLQTAIRVGSKSGIPAPGWFAETAQNSHVRTPIELRASFPFNGSGRFGSDVVDHAVDALDLVDDTVGDSLQQVVREVHPVGGHAVLRVHGAYGTGVGVGAHVAHDTHRHHWQEHGE